MSHRAFLTTNITALEASLQRLNARDDLTFKESQTVLELNIILQSLKDEVARYDQD